MYSFDISMGVACTFGSAQFWASAKNRAPCFQRNFGPFHEPGSGPESIRSSCSGVELCLPFRG
jgi:hypothetical protein